MERVLKDFISYLFVEKGLATNTLDSYQRDLQKYLHFLKQQHVVRFEDTSRNTVSQFLLHEKNKGLAPSTLSRHLAAIRSFYNYLLQERIVQKNPAAETESPRNEKNYPRSFL
jgi:integrase/recombinase XerD